MKAVVLAGGSGERFWPLSTKGRPKQFLDPLGKGSLLRMTYERLTERFDDHDIVVVTSSEHRKLTVQHLPELPLKNIIGEPERKNTCPACAIACLLFDDDIHLVVPADQYVTSSAPLWSGFDLALRAVRENDCLVTFGIPARRPETGYGYIEQGKEVFKGVHRAASFKEKPDKDTAMKMVSGGNHLWNSGIFVWRPRTFLSELSVHVPEVHGPLTSAGRLSGKPLSAAYSKLPSISVDHSLMERSERVFVVRSDLDWSDLGSWQTVKELMGPTTNTGKNVLLGSEDVLIRSSRKRPVAVVGLSDVIIVDSPEGLLVCSSRSAQEVRKVRKELRERGLER
ncbi:MAG: sugar phosphate nucleotidyltransferase [Candidatus Thermoplasmatota archaeon]|nr:sugar phosphate nucleotidyltransferase [Candidatus Thermoplasmatota archaeon]